MNVAPRPWVGRSRVCFCFFTKIIFKLTIDISMRKIIWKMEYFINSMIYQMLKFFKRITSFYPHMILSPKFCLEADTKNTGLLIFKSLKQKKLLFNFFVNRNWKKLTDSRKRTKILADNRKSHHPTETLHPSRRYFCGCILHMRLLAIPRVQTLPELSQSLHPPCSISCVPVNINKYFILRCIYLPIKSSLLTEYCRLL